jgi:hypothetical protein
MKTGARSAYESHLCEVLARVWRREGEHIVVDPAHMETPVTEILAKEAGSTRVDPDWLPSDLAELRHADREELLALVLEQMAERDGMRQRVLRVLMDFFFAPGPEPLLVLERVFMVARVMHEDHAWKMNLTEMATLLGRSKQDWQSIEERVLEDLVQRYSRVEFVMGAGKSAAARATYAANKKGNTSRKLGRRKGDEHGRPRALDDAPEMSLSREAKRRAEKMRQDAERRALAAEFGCEPEEIDLRKISPSDD